MDKKRQKFSSLAEKGVLKTPTLLQLAMHLRLWRDKDLKNITINFCNAFLSLLNFNVNFQ